MVSREDVGKVVRTPQGTGILWKLTGDKAIVEIESMYLVALPIEQVEVLEEKK